MTQWLIVAVVVAACFAYAIWTLLPTPGRRWLARHLARWPLPAAAVARLNRQAESTGGCSSCDSCEKSILSKAKSLRRRPAGRSTGSHAPHQP